MAQQDYTFKGWLGKDPSSVEGKMVWEAFEPKPFAEADVDIQISHSGICGSDLHTLRSGWGASDYPVCVGHEIVGRAVRVGKDVKKDIKVGDLVGVGAQSASCLRPDCEECTNGVENHCARMVQTYNGKHFDGSKTYGGYANYHRAPAQLCFKIPAAIDPADAAPMLCGGVTVYSPLARYGAGPGKKVGIVGVGGLGHFGILFAKALGADRVVGISRSNNKRDDILKMGADEYVATDDDPDWAKHHANSLDLIICTVSNHNMPLQKYLSLLRTFGQFIQVGAPEDKLPAIAAFPLIMKGVRMGGSAIGSAKEIEEMLQLAADKKIKPWIQQRPMKDANASVIDMDAGKARYRYVLVNDEAKL